jgi:AcrR family transcriptional regulator
MVKQSPKPKAKDLLVEETLNQISRDGAISVQPQQICERLGLSKALVNYHFGDRDGLILAAIVLGYERYVDTLKLAADNCMGSSVEKLLAWVQAQVDWTAANPGLAAALNFPSYASSVAPDSGSIERLEAAGTRNLQNLRDLIEPVRAESLSDPSQRTSDEFQAQIIMDTALVGWLTLGRSVWGSDAHVPTNNRNNPQVLAMADAYRIQALKDFLSR